MDNFYIKLHKGAEQPFYKTKPSEFFKGKSLKGKDDKRNNRVVNVPEIMDFVGGYSQFDPELIKSLWFRQLLHAQSLCEGFPKRLVTQADFRAIDEIVRQKVELFEQSGISDYRVNWRLAIGIGNASVFENSLTLHHVYGIPYIPATAVKGIVRSWLIQEYFSYDANGNKHPEIGEGRALLNSTFCYIFGTPSDFDVEIKKEEGRKDKIVTHKSILRDKEGSPTAHIGNIVFFDAYPIRVPNVVVDIMNPHYPDYYGEGKKPPSDWQNPKPIFFLTIKDTDFQFLFGIRKGCTAEVRNKLKEVEFIHPGNNRDLDKKGTVEEVLNQLLEEALGNNGAGAKTSAGYGRMKNLTTDRREQLRKTRLEQEEADAKEKAVVAELQKKQEKEAQDARDEEERRDRNKVLREEKRDLFLNTGIGVKLREVTEFEEAKAIIAEFKKVVGELPDSEFPAIKAFIERCYVSAESKSARSKWGKEDKGNWGVIRSWVNVATAKQWFKEIVK